MKQVLLLTLLLCGPLAAAETWTWWVEECTPDTAKDTGCAAGDPELAKWALAAWEREAAGKFKMVKVPSPREARIRIHWASAVGNLYGEARPILVNGQKGAEVFVLPDTRALGRDIHRAASDDPLFRETVVYLTCLHESGHALGLEHTADFADIMYTFQHGGNFVNYFGRYRRLLQKRGDIEAHSGISENDRVAIRK